MQIGREELKRKLKELDDELLISRDKSLYKLDTTKRTTLKTILGEIEIERRLYIFNNGIEKKFVYLLDEYLELFRQKTKYSTTILDIVQYKTCEENQSTREVSKFLKNSEISMTQQTVWELMKRIESGEIVS